MMPKCKCRFFRKAEMDLTMKSMFAVFMVIIVLFIIVYSVKTRTDTIAQRTHYDYYELSDNFLLSYISSPCISVGNYTNNTWQIPMQGLLDVRKLDKNNFENSDSSCSENYYFLYTLQIKETVSGNSWILGIKDAPRGLERTIATPLQVSIKYNNTIPPKITAGKAVLYTYIGPVPRFYGAIKQACVMQADNKFSLASEDVIKYDNLANVFWIGDQKFFAHFPCAVDSFAIPKGDALIYIKYKNNRVSVET